MKSVNSGLALALAALMLPGCAAKQWASKQYGAPYGEELPPAPQEQVPSYAPEYGQGADQAPAYAPMPTPAPPLATPPAHAAGPVSDTPVKVGAPYQVAGKTYTPEDNPMYDEVGYASWYGAELAGQQTANGETFNPAGISAAHKTLPLPSYVEVTRLDTGQTILVRVNDRGPFASDRVIDLSEGAARQLGITEQGAVGVRVRRVAPPESERVALREGRSVQLRIPTPSGLLDLLNAQLAKLPKPAAAPRQTQSRPAGPATAPTYKPDGGRFIVEGGGNSPSTSTTGYGTSYEAQYGAGTAPAAAPKVGNGGYIVQIAAFSSKSRADELARQMGASVVQSEAGGVYRVRMGPYATESEAQKALEKVKAKGYSGARVFTN